MSTITAGMVSELRARTGAGIMDCKKALAETDGNLEQAVEVLRKSGIAKAARKAGRATAEGLVHAYIHPGGKIGVLIEVNCETDFVARNETFMTLVHDLAMHVAAANPLSVRREEVDADLLAREASLYEAQAKESGKPEPVIRKMVEGRLNKFYEENVLLEQGFIKDPDKRVEDVIKEHISTIGENIVVRRFARYELGQDEA
ncbi:MAG TPA: translation elongation factor Ts [Candidatus Eisenbacteria bacterium]|nr:translation elongation factor Ts [Candidatus Eisenbacteria bacterium]